MGLLTVPTFSSTKKRGSCGLAVLAFLALALPAASAPAATRSAGARLCAPVTQTGVPGGIYGIRARGITCTAARRMLRGQVADQRNCARGWTCIRGVRVPWTSERRILSRKGAARVWWNFTDGGHGSR